MKAYKAVGKRAREKCEIGAKKSTALLGISKFSTFPNHLPGLSETNQNINKGEKEKITGKK